MEEEEALLLSGIVQSDESRADERGKCLPAEGLPRGGFGYLRSLLVSMKVVYTSGLWIGFVGGSGWLLVEGALIRTIYCTPYMYPNSVVEASIVYVTSGY